MDLEPYTHSWQPYAVASLGQESVSLLERLPEDMILLLNETLTAGDCGFHLIGGFWLEFKISTIFVLPMLSDNWFGTYMVTHTMISEVFGENEAERLRKLQAQLELIVSTGYHLTANQLFQAGLENKNRLN